MRKSSWMICSVALALVSVGCTSTQNVPRTERPAPAAWAMLPAPDLQTPLNGIISPSESESSQ
ncbi:Rz1 family lipoprotein [Citrobacter portucalensis]|uniref:Rz1 family lipoprotein n=1 Tax=Citrobacter portucalensis TaxID=1639133 RepID=UPI000949AE74|nr:Rz1 family lipoprotein [Citrobacter portucalensis]MCX8979050.1 Rz1 family lipoprotein [Citrobacter portucalensis]